MNWRPASVAMGLLAATVTSRAAITNDLADAEAEGRDVVRQLLATGPAENFTHTATLKILGGKGRKREVAVRSQVIVTATNWLTVYETLTTTNHSESEKLTVTHADNQPNHYSLWRFPANAREGNAGGFTAHAFAGSDFWLEDLALEFIHWPGQKILK